MRVGWLLFGGESLWRRRAEADEQRLFSPFNLREICLLDMAKAANLDRQTGQFDSDLVIGRRQAGKDFVNERFIIADQPTFEPPLLAAAENVKMRAAEAA